MSSPTMTPEFDELIQIDCQGTDCKNGCSTCGGYGYVLSKVECPCGQPYWTRPGNYTVYNGKTWTSVDGLKITFRTDGSTCGMCESG